MELKKITPEMRKKLREPLPQGAVSKHPTKTYLSSIKGIYVIERLNDVFGVGAWKNPSTVQEVKNGMVVVHSKLIIPEYGIELESFGGNDNGGEGGKNFDLGDAYKGACTDALTKMCSFLEIAIDVFKGNGNNPLPTVKAPNQQSSSTQDRTPAARPTQPKPAPIPQGETPILLAPTAKTWAPTIKGLKEKGKTKTDWEKNIKDKYLITEAHEKLLFKELEWA